MKRFQEFSNVKSKNDTLNSTLKLLEFNITTSCNLSCSFCPHSWGFKQDKRNKFMSLETIDKLIEWSKSYENSINLSGFGEPTLHPNIKEILDKLQVLDNKIILITNGYKLKEVAPHLGKILPRVSLYEPMELPDIEYETVDYVSGGNNEYFNNRSYGEGIKKPCYIPAYKMFIDTDGGILPCSNNWENRNYLTTIYEDTLESAWFEKFDQFRKNCAINRTLNEFCKNCDTHGTLYGKEECELLK